MSARSRSKRSGDPRKGSFNDAIILKTFGEVPDRLDRFEER